MPIYLFENEESGEVKEFIVSVKEIKGFSPGDGWKRIYTAPNVAIDTRINAFSPKEFAQKTKNKKGTIGDLLDRSRELSAARGGEKNDPVLKKYYKNYEKEKGIKHANEILSNKKEKIKQNLKKRGISTD
jgi:hypothetical protein